MGTQVLWDATLSSLKFTDPALISQSDFTYHPGRSCNKQVVADLYKMDGTCRHATSYFNVTTTYGDGVISPVSTGQENGYNFVQFDSDKTLCFVATDNQAVIWGRGLNNTAAQCHVVRFRGPPVFIQLSALGAKGRDSPFPDIDLHGLGNGTSTLEALVGREVNFTIRARDPNVEDHVTILIVEEPGLPVGATLGPNTCVSHGRVDDNKAYPINQYGVGGQVDSTCAEAFRVFRWTPKVDEDGATYRICFVAVDNSGVCAGPYDHIASDPGVRATSGGYYSRPHCVDIKVLRADTAWLPGTVATEAGANKVEHVGCQVEYALRAGDTSGSGTYNTLISFAPDSAPPPGMRMVTISSGLTHSVVLQWTPARGMEGSHHTVCVIATPQGWTSGDYGNQDGPAWTAGWNPSKHDPAYARDQPFHGSQPSAAEYGDPHFGNPRLASGARHAPRRCIHIKIRRCKYCVNPSDSLLSLMKGISPDLNWLRLWAANGNDDNDVRTSTIQDPDMLALDSTQQIFNVGPVYRTMPGDSLMSVAARFRTTIKSLLLLNPDVALAAVLPQQQELCLIPCAA